MKKTIRVIAALHLSASSIAFGSSVDVQSSRDFLVGVDSASRSEMRLIRGGTFEYDCLSGRLTNHEVDLLAWRPGQIPQNSEFNLEQITRALFFPTREIEWIGNLSSGSATPVGESFVEQQCVYDNDGTPHNLAFKFTRLPSTLDAHNKIQYSLEINDDKGRIKRADASGVAIDSSGVPLIITFNHYGHLNLFDYGQSTESDVPPKMYIEPRSERDSFTPFTIVLNWGKGAGLKTGATIHDFQHQSMPRLTAYDGFSRMSERRQDGGHAYHMVLGKESPLRFSWISEAVGLETQGLVFPLMFVRPTTQVELQGNLSSSSATPIGVPFTKTQRIFDSMGTPHNLIFKFTRLPAGSDSDNEIQYSTEVTVEGGVVKRLDTTGAAIDSTGSPMILTFNQSGQMNLCDYGQPTESNLPPKFYIEWYNPYILSAPLTIELNLGRGKGASPTTWEGALEPFAEGNLCAYDGNSLITYSHQDGTGMGKYESLSVSELGEVTAQYSCGMKHVGSLVYAKVPKPEGLEPIGNSFRISAASGMPVLFHK